MRIITGIILFLLLQSTSGAQEILPVPEAKLLARVPFKQFSGGVMIIKACFENVKDSLNFILDTGSGGISLDSSTCKEFGIPVWRRI